MMIASKFVVGGLAALLLVPGPGVAEPDRSPSPARISWQPCAEPYFAGMDCGTMPVPQDWSRPRAGDISLSLVRRRAEEPAGRLGSLVLNNGVGGSSIEQLRFGLESGAIPGAVLARRFDLIAVDPRGVGHSTPATCGGRPQRASGVTAFPATDAQYRALVNNNRALAAACGTVSRLANLGLANTARDMEAVRVGLGERQLNWYGIEWSTLLGKTYGRLFPGRLRTMVGDSVMDDNLSPVARLAGEISAAEDSFNRFTDWCRITATCALSGQDVAAVFDRLVATADRKPIPTRTPGRALTGEDIRFAMQGLLNLKFPLWPRAAVAIRKAVDGDASDFTVVFDKTLDPVQAQLHSCVDVPPAATTLAEFAQLTRLARQLSPHLGGAVRGWAHLAGCQGWPAPASRPDTRPVRDVPPALLVQSTHQSSVAYQWAFGLSATLPGSVVFSRDGDEYSMYVFSPCVRRVADAYLVDRRLPAPGSICSD